MIHELRTYTCIHGKVDAQVEKMGKLMPVFEKCGIKIVALWTTLVGRAEHFVYILEWESLADREKKLPKFFQDPDLHRILEEFGPTLQFEDSVILQPTAYSPLR